METLLHNLSEVFAISIIHSLWQCLLIYLVLRILLADVLRLSAQSKYNITVAGLLLCTLWFIYTLFDQASNYSWQLGANKAAFSNHLPLWIILKQTAHLNDHYELLIAHELPYITTVYIVGLIFNSLRLLTGWFQIQQLKQSGNTNQGLQQMIGRLSAMLNLNKQIALVCTDKLDVPCITGYFKPLILMPLSLINYLSVQEVETILLHELAHAKRNDYLVNLLQQVISVVLFFNPFILLMNRIASRERENSCDDMVVSITGKPLVYAQALLKIEQSKVQTVQLALAAAGKNKFHLLNRIERIMKTKKPMTNIRHLVLAFTILAGSLSSIAWFNPSIANGKLTVNKVHPTLEKLFWKADTTKKTKESHQSANLQKPHNSIKNNHQVNDNHNMVYTDGFSDPKLEEFSKKMEALGKKIEAYYDNPEFKKLSENLELKGKEMQAFYDNPELKKLTAAHEKLGNDFAAEYGDNSQMEAIGKQMEGLGKKMEAYYNSPEFKQLNDGLKKKYNIPDHYVYVNDDKADKDDNYHKYQAELKKHIPDEVSAASSNIKKLGEQMRNYYNAPDRKAMLQQMHSLSDSVRNAYRNPRIKAQQQEIRNMSDQIREYTNNPQIKELQSQMRDLGRQMKAYTNSPEFKKRMEEAKKNMKAMNWNFNYNTDDKPADVASPTAAPEPATVPDVSTIPATPALPPAPQPAKP